MAPVHRVMEELVVQVQIMVVLPAYFDGLVIRVVSNELYPLWVIVLVCNCVQYGLLLLCILCPIFTTFLNLQCEYVIVTQSQG